MRYWLWKVLKLPYVFPPGHYVLKELYDLEESRTIILEDVVLQGADEGMTIHEYMEAREVDV